MRTASTSSSRVVSAVFLLWAGLAVLFAYGSIPIDGSGRSWTWPFIWLIAAALHVFAAIDRGRIGLRVAWVLGLWWITIGSLGVIYFGVQLEAGVNRHGLPIWITTLSAAQSLFVALGVLVAALVVVWFSSRHISARPTPPAALDKRGVTER